MSGVFKVADPFAHVSDGDFTGEVDGCGDGRNGRGEIIKGMKEGDGNTGGF